MSATFATTKVQLVTGEVLETEPMDFHDALRERTRVEEVMCKPKTDPTLRFHHRAGTRILASQHIVQAWTEQGTILPAKKPDPEA